MSEKMIFCIGDGCTTSSGEGYQKNYHIFNKKISQDEYNRVRNAMPLVKLPVASWVYAKDMTDDEKKNNSDWKTLNGYLKHLSYQDAFKEMWSKISQEEKNWFVTLPNFDAEIWTKITGMNDPRVKNLSGKKVEVTIDGEKYSATLD